MTDTAQHMKQNIYNENKAVSTEKINRKNIVDTKVTLISSTALTKYIPFFSPNFFIVISEMMQTANAAAAGRT